MRTDRPIYHPSPPRIYYHLYPPRPSNENTMLQSIVSVHRLARISARFLIAKSREKLPLCYDKRLLADKDHLTQLIRNHKQTSTTPGKTTSSSGKSKNHETKRKVTVITWDTSHNALGRAYLLADVLHQDYQVEVIGTSFLQSNTQVWEPLRNCSRVPIRAFPGYSFPHHFRHMENLAKHIDSDMIYVSKPRLPSMELAILAKQHRNRPILIDIDDHELSFFKNSTPLSLDAVKARFRKLDFHCPYGETWTRYSESLIPYFDQITVSNEELHKKYGGLVLPHVRDEHDFQPSSILRNTLRSALGFSSHDMVLLFIGTPRVHKGLPRVYAALNNLRRPNYKLLIVGSPVDNKTRRFFRRLDPSRVKLIPNISFGDLACYLCVGDLLCVIQDEDALISQFQLPAKVTDALSMGIPVLASNVPPFLSLAKRNLVEILCDASLEEKIDMIFSDYTTYKTAAIRNRDIFLREYSYHAYRPKLKILVDTLLKRPRPVSREFTDLIAYHRDTFLDATKNKRRS